MSENRPSKPASREDKRAQRATAVALKHKLGSGELPKIKAAGYGKVAEKIVELAFAHDVRVREDPDLAQLLATVEVDTEIPSQALMAVAEVLYHVYRANGSLAHGDLARKDIFVDDSQTDDDQGEPDRE